VTDFYVTKKVTFNRQRLKTVKNFQLENLLENYISKETFKTPLFSDKTLHEIKLILQKTIEWI